MNQREKLLVGLVLGLVLLIGGGFGLRAVVFKPVKDLDKITAVLRDKLSKAQEERRNFFTAEDKVKTYTLRSFADTIDESSAASGELLTRQIIASGLKESDFTRLPAGPRKLKGGSEIGWSVQGQGGLTNVINLLFMLRESPWLHQVEGLSINQGDVPGTVHVRFRYLTLVIEPAPDVKRKPLVAKATLESPERHLLDTISTRDILRPYIKRPRPPAGKPGDPAAPGTAPVPPGPESLRVVSLSEWQGQPEVHVRDAVNQKTTRYRPGDSLAGGKVVMVDYRAKALPGHSLVQSYSRVILKIENDYYAVERGTALSEKWKMAREDLPTELSRLQ